jgi:hypothetical protein
MIRVNQHDPGHRAGSGSPGSMQRDHKPAP